MNKQSGFTLMELMVTVAVIAIVVAIATPDLKAWIAKERLNSSANEIRSVFERAKMAAIKEHCEVVVEFNTGTGSSGQYRVFVDSVGGATGSFDSGEREIVPLSAMKQGVVLQSAAFNGGWSVSTRFNPMGLPAGFDGAVVLKSDKEGFLFRRIAVGFAGVIKLETSTDGATWNG